jgi:hypothetical protein
VIKGETSGLCVEHNHIVSKGTIDGFTQKRFEAELTPEEFAFMMDIGAYVPAGKLRRMMRWRWANIDYCDDLIYRVRAKGRVHVFGSDPDAVNSFMTMGRKVISDGGVFEVIYDASMRIEEIYLQKPSLKPYAEIYGDFTILDGTFKISAYNLTLMIFSNVDCFGKTTITGLVFAPTEASDAAIKGARLFGLDCEGSVLMTDGASAFSLTAATLKQRHLLCLHHFRTALFSCTGSMSVDVRGKFLQVRNTSTCFDIFVTSFLR